MLEWIADYRVLEVLDDPGRPNVRVTAAPPGRLALGDGTVVVEIVEGDPVALVPWLTRWAGAAQRGHLSRPLEVGPAPTGGAAGIAGRSFISRHPGGTTGALSVAAAAGAAAGLADLHAAGLVHGAITAGRVLTVGGSGVLDLPPADVTTTALLAVAPSADALDTLAPEVLRGEAPGPGSDVWSLAACVLRSVSGQPVHPGIEDDVLLAGVSRIAHERPTTTGVEGRLGGLLGACLDLDPDRRPDASALADGLEQLRGAA